MTRIRVDPRKVERVEMRDGTTYPIGRNGWVDITRPDHARDIERQGHGEVADVGFILPRIGFMSTGRNDCPACGFGAWPWTKACPRCGEAL